MEHLKAKELSSTRGYQYQENRRTRIFLRNGRNNHSRKYDTIILPMLVPMRPSVPPTVGPVWLHRTLNVIVLLILLLLVSGEFLMIFVSNFFFIPFLRELSRETLSRYRSLTWLGKFFEMGRHLSSINYLPGQWFSKIGPKYQQQQHHLGTC